MHSGMIALLLTASLPLAQAASPPAASAPANPYGRVVDLIGCGSYVVLLRDAEEALIRLDDKGHITATRLRAELPSDSALAPTALAWAEFNGRDVGGDLLMLTEGGRGIYRFSEDLVAKGCVVRDAAMRGAALCVGPGGEIFVADRATPGVRVFDAAGKPLATLGKQGTFDAHQENVAAEADRFSEPSGICIDKDGRVLVVDRGNMTYVIYEYSRQERKLTYRGHGPWMARPNRIMLNRYNQLVLTGALDDVGPYGAIRVLQPGGSAVNGMGGYDVGMMSPRCTIAMGPGARMFIADPEREHILILPCLFYEKAPTLKWSGPITVQMEANRIDRHGMVLTTVNDFPVPTSQPAWLEVKQEGVLCDAWPPLKTTQVRSYLLPLRPSLGRNYVIDMPVVIAVFTQARMDGKRTAKIGTDELGERLQHEFERVRDFYFRNSQGLLNLQFEFLVLDGVTAEVTGGWVPPPQGRRMVNEARGHAGLPPLMAGDSLVTIYPTQDWDMNAIDDPGVVGEGGGRSEFAYSSFGLCNRGIAWALCDAWDRQLYEYFMRSGMPEFRLNHPDGTLHIGRYGPHWDCIAFALRQMNRMQWLQLKYGFLRLIKDSDGDGLADDDPSLPLDEKRFGSDPLSPDTDGDGLDDLAEATAGSFSATNPKAPDSDFDGLQDKIDPYPRYVVMTDLKAADVKIDGRIEGKEYSPLGALAADWVHAFVLASHGRDRLFVAFDFDGSLDTLYADVDIDNAGWFVGSGHVAAQVDLDWKVADQPTIARTMGCKAALGVIAEAGNKPRHYQLEMEIPFAGRLGQPQQTPGGLGLMVHARRGEHHEAFLIDPWAFLRCEFR